MVHFLETEDEVKQWQDKEKLVILVLSDPKKHWVLNQVSFAYFYDLNLFEEAIISINHIDASNLHISVLRDFLGENNYIYQKKILGDCGLNFEAQIAFWLETNQRLEQEYNQVIRSYHHSYPNLENCNDIIPIMKWLEWCRDLKDEFVLKVKDYEITNTLLEYDKLLENLSIIEKNGLCSK